MGSCTPLWFHPVNLRFVMWNDMIWRNTITCNNTGKQDCTVHGAILVSIRKTPVADILRSKKLKTAMHVGGLLIYINKYLCASSSVTKILAWIVKLYWCQIFLFQ